MSNATFDAGGFEQGSLPPPSPWRPDPTGRHQFRLWDGGHWTDHVADSGVVSLDTFSRKTVSSPLRSAQAGRRLGGLTWFGICFGVFVVGGLLTNAGSKETVSAIGLEETSYTATAKLGMSMMCFALALFFGRNSFRSLGRVVRGGSSLGDSLFAGMNVKFAVISVLAALGAVVLLGAAIVG